MAGRLICIARSRRGAPSASDPFPPPPGLPPLFCRVRPVAWLLPLAVAAALCAAPRPAPAQEAPGGPPPAGEEQQPAVFTADDVTYDDVLDIVVARGNVEISQGGRIVRADTVTYNRRTRVVTASGNVVLVEPDGDVLFASYAELLDDLKEGFVQSVSVLFTDESRMIGTTGIREGDLTAVDRAVYSPCYLCAENPREAPIWQIRAVRATHDRESRDVSYQDAFLDLFGFPVIYTPYLSHPDPTVERRQGFLAPSFGTRSAIGPFVHGRYYFDIAPEQDATADLIATRDAGFVLGGEYRRRFADGSLLLRGSVNRSDREEIENGVTVTEENAFRWHIDGNALYDIDENWRAGAVVRRVSDDTYLKAFNFPRADVLRTRGFAEGFYGLSYAAAEVFSFQDLRQFKTDQAEVVPWMGYSYVGDPGEVLGGQVLFNVGGLQLLRDPVARTLRLTDIEGVDTRRLSFDAGWQREMYSETGLVTSLSARVSSDLYWSDGVPDLTSPNANATRNDVTASRFYPRVTAAARYPLVRQGGTTQQLIEPIIAFSAAPNFGDDEDIPNNDSRDLEFDEINLFSDNRYPGRDRVDGGTRFTYGLRTGIFSFGGASATLFLGQSYRFSENSSLPAGSGLETQLSDVVGRLNLAPSPLFNLDWRFRLNEEDLSPRRQEIVASAGTPILRLYGIYSFLEETAADIADNTTGTSDTGEYFIGYLTSRIANYWTATSAVSYDLAAGETRSVGVGLSYIDECFTFATTVTRDYTDDRDADGGLTVLVTLAFRNLGEIPININADDLLGGTNQTSSQ